MVQGKWFPQGGEISVPLALRQAVFSRGQDEADALAQQVVVYQEGEPVGAARLWWADGAFHLGDVGVLKDQRGKGYGDLLVRLLLFKALSHHAIRVELTAPVSVQGFFARYGFRPIHPPWDGETHVRMDIDGEAITLSHCGESCDGQCEGCTLR